MQDKRRSSSCKSIKRRRGDEGFSLIELIIVIAIMVALIAVLAPQFTRYAGNARDAVVNMAAEDALAIAKSEYAFKALEGTGTITISVPEDKGYVTFDFSDGLKYGDGEDNGEEEFAAVCGVDENKKVKSDKVYIITIGEEHGLPTFSMTHN